MENNLDRSKPKHDQLQYEPKFSSLHRVLTLLYASKIDVILFKNMHKFQPLHADETRVALSTYLENSSTTLLIYKLQMPTYFKIPVSMRYAEF